MHKLVHFLVGQVAVPGVFVGLCGPFVALEWYFGCLGFGFGGGSFRILGP